MKWTMCWAASVAVACSLVAGRADACSAPIGSDACDRWALSTYGALVSGGGIALALPSMTTNIGIAVYAAQGRAAPRGWSVAGTVLWSASTAVGLVGTSMQLYAFGGGPPPSYAGLLAMSSAHLAVSVASLSFSLWSLGRGAADEGAPRSVALVPWSGDRAGVSVLGAF
jgi:hypothetical protein